MSYYDNTGLLRKYGTEKAVPSVAGEYVTNGSLRQIEFKIDLTKVGSSSAVYSNTVGQVDNLFFPKMRIEEIEIVAHTAATGSGATLNIGLVKTDRTTEVDADGLVAALPTTSVDAAGEKTVLRVGSTYAGALIGTTIAYPSYLVTDYDTAAFTAGVIFVRIKYYAA